MTIPRPLPRLAGLIGLTASLFVVPVFAVAADKGASCRVLRNWVENRTLEGCEFPGNPSDAETSARRFIDAHLGDLGMLQGSVELEHVETRQGLAGQHVRFQQVLGGYPVYGALVAVVQDQEGRTRRLSSSYNATRMFAAGKRAVTREAAEQIARRAVGREAGALPQVLGVMRARQVWYPRADGVLVLAWELAIGAEHPLVHFQCVVDGTTGEVLLNQDRLVYNDLGRGRVFRPNPVQSSGNTALDDNSSAALVNAELVDVDLPGLNFNTGLLKGKWVEVQSALYPVADEPSRQYLYDLPDHRVAQVNAYYAIDSVQRYIRSIGFNDDRTTPNGIRGYPTVVDAHHDNTDFSAYSPPPGDKIYFGDGGIPDAEDADIVVHEYGHAIQHAQNASWGCSGPSNCEMNAMGEGFSDYLAASIHAKDGDATYQQANAACVGEWDSKGYVDSQNQPAPQPCLRRVDGNKVYPTGKVGEVHKDGEIWSRSLWDIRAAIGDNVANQIILEHHFSLPTGTTMPQAALAMIDVDAQLFGGANEVALRNAFCAPRNILTGADCTPSPGTKAVIPVAKDTFVRQALTERNDGASPRLRLKGTPGEKTRVLLRFDLSGVDVSTVRSAVLEMTVAYSDQAWGRFGRTVDVHPLLYDFVEGNGVGAGAADADKKLGSGPGATWNCSNDTDIGNTAPDCASGLPWIAWIGGRVAAAPFGAGTGTPPVVQNNGATGRVRWAVTADVKAGVRGWAVKATFDLPGLVDYYSQEGAAAAGDLTLAPRLVITFNN